MNRSSLILAAVVLGVVGLVLLVRSGRPPQSAPDASLGVPLAALGGASALPAGPGEVRGHTAPSARVSAFPAWTAPAPDPEEKACPCEGECGRTSAACSCDAVRARAEALLAAHRRASTALAAATSSEDGSFVLAGLAPGEKVDLWAETAAGVGRAAGVAVGATGVEIALEPGVLLEGQVALPSGAEAGSVAMLAFTDGFGRLFEFGADGAGRAQFGPVPAGMAWRIHASAGELRGSDWLSRDETRFDLRLEGPSLVAGMVIGGSTRSPGAAVRLDAPHCHLDVVSDAEGRFSFSRFGAGGIVVSAQAGGRQAAEGFFLEPGGRKEDVVLDLGRSTALAGTVRGPDGKGVSGAEVSYWLRRPSTGVVPGLPISRRTAVCGADGGWSAEGVAPGSYSLQATAPGFAESQVALVEAAAGERKQVEFALEPQSILAGRVVDPQGRPVEGAELTVRQEAERPKLFASKQERAEQLLQRRRATARSGADGAFRVEGLAAGAYSLSAAKEGFGHRPQSVQAPDEKVEVALLAAGGIRGEVVDARGAPAAGALVRLSAARDRGSSGAAGRLARESARADGQGRFHVPDLADGSWVVEATPRGSAWGEAPSYAKALVEVQPGAAAEVHLALQPTLAISGVVVDGAGEPVPAALIDAMREDRDRVGTLSMPSFRTTRAAPDGSFTLRGLDGGSWRVTARKDLFRRSEQDAVPAGAQALRLVLERLAAVRGQLVDVQGRPVTAFEVNGEARADPDGRFAVAIRRTELFTITFSAAGLASTVRSYSVMEEADFDAGRIVLTKGRRVAGKVFDEKTRAPVAGARVFLGEESLRLGQVRASNPGVAVSDETGAFTLQLEEGATRVRVAHPRYKAAVVPVAAGAAAVEVALSPGATLRGRVVDREGRPQRAMLFVGSRPGGRSLSESGDDGAFEFTGLAAGTWTVSAVLAHGEEQGARLSATVEVPEAGEAFVELRPKTSGATVVVTLKGAGAGADGCGGMLFPTPEPGRPASVDLPPTAKSRQGTVTFQGIEPGQYQLLVACGVGKKRTQASQQISVAWEGEQRTELVIPMPP